MILRNSFNFINHFFKNIKKKIKIIYLVASMSIISFATWMFLHSIGGANPAFFLLPTRIWQFGLSSFLPPK